MIPAAPGVDLSLLHPILLRRLDALHALVPSLYVLSGPRTFAKQLALWLRSKLPGQPVAANPYRIIGTVTIFGVTFTARGGWHQVQETGFAYAADVHPDEDIPFELVPWHSDYLAGAPAPLGLTRTVQPSRRSAWELWHIQAIPDITTPYDEEHPLMALSDAEQTDLLGRVTRVDGEVDQALSLLRRLVDAVEHVEEGQAQSFARIFEKGVKLTAWQRAALDGNLAELLDEKLAAAGLPIETLEVVRQAVTDLVEG